MYLLKMKKFELVCANEKNPKWSKIIERERPLYTRENELRLAIDAIIKEIEG